MARESNPVLVSNFADKAAARVSKALDSLETFGANPGTIERISETVRRFAAAALRARAVDYRARDFSGKPVARATVAGAARAGMERKANRMETESRDAVNGWYKANKAL